MKNIIIMVIGKMVVYLDVVLLENIIMNFLILYTASIVIKNKPRIFNILISSIIGAIYYLSILLPETSYLNFLAYKILISIIMVLISFPRKSLQSFFNNLLSFYMISFIYGGAIYGIYNMVSYITYTNVYIIKIVIPLSLILFLLIKYEVNRIKQKIIYSQYKYSVDIYIENKIKKLNFLLDTGNSLREPLTNKPVIIVNYCKIKEILPSDVINVCCDDIGKITDIEYKYANKIKVLPYISLGNQNGIMIGYKVDKIKIFLENKKINEIDNITMAINTTDLNGKDDYDGLINIELLEYKGGNVNERITVG